MRIQYSDGINFDWPKGWQCWTLASNHVRVEESNTRLKKRKGQVQVHLLTLIQLQYKNNKKKRSKNRANYTLNFNITKEKSV